MVGVSDPEPERRYPSIFAANRAATEPDAPRPGPDAEEQAESGPVPGPVPEPVAASAGGPTAPNGAASAAPLPQAFRTHHAAPLVDEPPDAAAGAVPWATALGIEVQPSEPEDLSQATESDLGAFAIAERAEPERARDLAPDPTTAPPEPEPEPAVEAFLLPGDPPPPSLPVPDPVPGAAPGSPPASDRPAGMAGAGLRLDPGPLPQVDAGAPAIPAPAPEPEPAVAPVPAAPARASVRRPLPRVMSVANQKGGVGKTTTAVNLGAALAELGYRVLVVDLDPQGNATTGLGINARGLSSSIYDVLLGDLPLEDCIEPTAVRNLFLAPATIDLAGAEIELVPAFSRELRLRRAIERLDGEYEYVLIDCPPSLGLLTVNGLAASTEVVVPIQCEYYALEGLGQLLRNVTLVQTNLNPRLEMSTIILTMYDARTKLADQVAKEVRAHFGDKVCRNIVPRTVRLSEAPSFGQPIIVFDSTSRGALAYRELAKEVSGGAPQRAG